MCQITNHIHNIQLNKVAVDITWEKPWTQTEPPIMDRRGLNVVEIIETLTKVHTRPKFKHQNHIIKFNVWETLLTKRQKYIKWSKRWKGEKWKAQPWRMKLIIQGVKLSRQKPWTQTKRPIMNRWGLNVVEIAHMAKVETPKSDC